MGEIAHCFLPGKFSGISKALFLLPLYNRFDALVDFVTTILLQVPSDIAQQGDVANSSHDEDEEGTGKDDDGGGSCDYEGGSGQAVIVLEVLCNIVPGTRLFFLGNENRVESEGVDGLTGCVSQEKTFPTLEDEEDKESKVVAYLCRVANVVKEAKMVV